MRELRKETEIDYKTIIVVNIFMFIIRNERTPKGDGNIFLFQLVFYQLIIIRNERTPKGDGNYN